MTPKNHLPCVHTLRNALHLTVVDVFEYDGLVTRLIRLFYMVNDDGIVTAMIILHYIKTGGGLEFRRL